MGRADRANQFDANFVAGAKDFERAAKQDLEQYRQWLDHYAAADQKDRLKHERRLKREQRRYRREVKLRYVRRLIYRYASAFLRFVRTTVRSCWNAAIVFSVVSLLLVLAIAKWIAVKAQVFALLIVRSVQGAIAWMKPRTYRTAIRSRRQSVRAATWTGAQVSHARAWTGTQSARALSFAGAKSSQAAAWTATQSSRAFTVAGTKGSQAASWTAAQSKQAVAFTGAQAKSGARTVSHAASTSSAWLGARAHDAALAVPPMMHATRRGALRARDFTVAHALGFRDGAALRFNALSESVRRLVTVGERAEPVEQPAIALLTFQPPQGALVPVEPACTALTVFEPAPWTGAAERGINITAPETLTDPAPEAPSPKRKRDAVKARPRKPRRGPHRKRHQNSSAPGKPRPRGRKRPRAG